VHTVFLAPENSKHPLPLYRAVMAVALSRRNVVVLHSSHSNSSMDMNSMPSVGRKTTSMMFGI
jgi:hypothetical protein